MISLVKGQKLDLTKGNAGLTLINVGLGWDVQSLPGGQSIDLDAAVFVLGADGKMQRDEDFIFYNNKTHPSGGVVYMGDNQTGEGDGDDEVIEVDLSKLTDDIHRVVFTVSIYDGDVRNQNFGQVNNAYIRVWNKNTNEELVRYDLTEDFSIETALVIAEIYRHNGEWKVGALGTGYQGGLPALCRNFGANV